jgi:hypothetical protein
MELFLSLVRRFRCSNIVVAAVVVVAAAVVVAAVIAVSGFSLYC